MFGLKQKHYDETPLELLDVASLGGEAETVKRVIGKILKDELDSLFTKLSTCKPDLGEYAHYSGQVFMIHKILRSLEIRTEDGKEAVQQLKGGTKWLSR